MAAAATKSRCKVSARLAEDFRSITLSYGKITKNIAVSLPPATLVAISTLLDGLSLDSSQEVETFIGLIETGSKTAANDVIFTFWLGPLINASVVIRPKIALDKAIEGRTSSPFPFPLNALRGLVILGYGLLSPMILWSRRIFYTRCLIPGWKMRSRLISFIHLVNFRY